MAGSNLLRSRRGTTTGSGSATPPSTAELALIGEDDGAASRKIVSRAARDASGATNDLVATGAFNSTRNFNAFSIGSGGASKSAEWVLPNQWRKYLVAGAGLSVEFSARVVRPIDDVLLTDIGSYRLSVIVKRLVKRVGAAETTVTVRTIAEGVDRNTDFAFAWDDFLDPASDLETVKWRVEVEIFSDASGVRAKVWDTALNLISAVIRIIPPGTLRWEAETALAQRPSMADQFVARNELAPQRYLQRATLVEMPGSNVQRRLEGRRTLLSTHVADVEHDFGGGGLWDPGLIPDPLPLDTELIVYEHDFAPWATSGTLEIQTEQLKITHGNGLSGGASRKIDDYAIDQGRFQDSTKVGAATGSKRCVLRFANKALSSTLALRGRHMARVYGAVAGSGAWTSQQRGHKIPLTNAVTAISPRGVDGVQTVTWEPFSRYEVSRLVMLFRIDLVYHHVILSMSELGLFSSSQQNWDYYLGLLNSHRVYHHFGRGTTAWNISMPTYLALLRLTPYSLVQGGVTRTWPQMCGGLRLENLRNAAGLTAGDLDLVEAWVVI